MRKMFIMGKAGTTANEKTEKGILSYRQMFESEVQYEW